MQIQKTNNQIETQQAQVKKVFLDFLNSKKYRNTPERYAVLKEIYTLEGHFNIELLFKKMNKENYRVTKATLYNTIGLLLECNLVRRHQFGDEHQAYYEKSFFNKQHDHLILSDTGEVLEFCDPRINNIKKSIEEGYNVKIDSHTLYFYGTKNKKK